MVLFFHWLTFEISASRFSHALVREFVARCDCVESIKRNTSAVASFYGAQIVLALEHLENWGLLGTYVFLLYFCFFLYFFVVFVVAVVLVLLLEFNFFIQNSWFVQSQQTAGRPRSLSQNILV